MSSVVIKVLETVETGGGGGRMQQDQESEPLFGEEVYSLLRDDSLLARTGSNNFAALIEPSDPPTPQNYNNLPPHQQQQQPDVVVGGGQNGVYYQVQPNSEDLFALPWSMVVENNNDLQITDGPDQLIVPEHVHQQQQSQQRVRVVEGGVNIVADSSTTTTSLPPAQPPSLQPWPGRYNFNVSVPIDNRDRNKWCYSPGQRKLYTCPNVAVPVGVMLNQWTNNTSILITPVFKDSRFRMDPVRRCYNCKNGQDPSLAEHLVQVEGEGCEYQVINERYVVSVPVHAPAPGDITSTLLVKLTCLTSCVGGPNRRQFCLIFQLRNNATGEEIGRQVLDVKCCKCPSRDMTNGNSLAQRANEEEKLTQVKQLASTISVGQKRKKPDIKLEPETGTRYVDMKIPAEFVNKVKSYVNSLVAEKYMRLSSPGQLPYPDVD